MENHFHFRISVSEFLEFRFEFCTAFETLLKYFDKPWNSQLLLAKRDIQSAMLLSFFDKLGNESLKKDNKNGSNNPICIPIKQLAINQDSVVTATQYCLFWFFFHKKNITWSTSFFFSPDLRLLTGNCSNFKLFYHSSIENIFWMQ